ncbi:helix-turn-helix transcriptional regulator [Roseburia sp. MSJ-14]|uniref:helix-turn-helix transcriptional regulator n=1 Tax=Roseburia sp. MSJ-14 TaxID=2841514 RepID=UPI001C0FCE0D|nr:helix-turn-helix transcriptional regulator [Roseburia sp. MSJ-14]MBU5474054.1 helix-turn-helix domain-containing protein [Roseburia sp. MSJ-14]
MAEFGENIRKAREEKGITQQTLADRLYVTRQAVSRWENGSRYPDLLTAKALARALDTTLNDLLNDDDMQTYPEVNPVIEYPVHKRVLTALFAVACSVNLILTLWNTFYYLTDARAFRTVYESAVLISRMVFLTLVTVILFYGFIKSVKDEFTPQAAKRIMLSIVVLNLLGVLFRYYLSWRNYTALRGSAVIAAVAVNVAFIIIVSRFFRAKNPCSPIPVYVFTGLEMLFELIDYVLGLIAVIGTAQLRSYLTNTTLSTLALLSVEILFIYMTAVLHRKRKLTKTQS